MKCNEKAVTKLVSCIFCIAKLATIAEDALEHLLNMAIVGYFSLLADTLNTKFY